MCVDMWGIEYKNELFSIVCEQWGRSCVTETSVDFNMHWALYKNKEDCCYLSMWSFYLDTQQTNFKYGVLYTHNIL